MKTLQTQCFPLDLETAFANKPDARDFYLSLGKSIKRLSTMGGTEVDLIGIFYDRHDTSRRFRKGSVVAIETFISTKSPNIQTESDGWTLRIFD